jgi:hypothetical protein
METKHWPTRTVRIERGYNWAVELYEPTMAEIDKLKDLEQEKETPEGREQFQRGIAPLFARWDCVDRDGQPIQLPTSVDITPFSRIPQLAFIDILSGLFHIIGGKSDPKEPKSDTDSSPSI